MLKIAYQGEIGAFSNEAAAACFPDDDLLPCVTFEQTINAVQSGMADRAVVPVENSLYGRIADIHHMLPESGLHIVGEYFLPIHMNLLGIPGTKLADVKTVQSLSVALGQCRKFIAKNNLITVNAVDTAGSAREIAERGDPTATAIASELAGKTYGLEVLASHIEDAEHNTTRFLVMSRDQLIAPLNDDLVRTTFVFRVRNVPAALYKAMGGFATNGINMTKLESYMVEGSFTATQFYADIEGHPDEQRVKYAFEELEFFTDNIKILGTYPGVKPRS